MLMVANINFLMHRFENRKFLFFNVNSLEDGEGLVNIFEAKSIAISNAMNIFILSAWFINKCNHRNYFSKL